MASYTSDVDRLISSLPQWPPPVARPVILVVSGLPGSGKSYFSRRLVEQLPLLLLESDALRQVLFPNPGYTGRESSQLFRACHLLIEGLLRKGIPVLLDATNLVEENRERLYHIAEHTGAKLIIVHLKAPPEVVRERLRGRSDGVDVEDKSTADWQVYDRMRSTAEPIRRNHFVVDTSRDISPAVAKVVRETKRWMRTC